MTAPSPKDYLYCDDFSSAVHEPTQAQSEAYAIAEALGFSCSFEFNRAYQGAMHALSGRENAYPNNAHYAAGFEAAAN